MKQPQSDHEAHDTGTERNGPNGVVREREYGRGDPDQWEEQSYRDERHKDIVQRTFSVNHHFDYSAAPDVRSRDHSHPDNSRENNRLRDPRIHGLQQFTAPEISPSNEIELSYRWRQGAFVTPTMC